MGWWSKKNRGTGDASARAELDRDAQRHYRQGNRFFHSQAWEPALAEWRRAAEGWRLARARGRRLAGRLIHLRAAAAFLLIVLAVYWALFSFFPRDSFEIFMLSSSASDNRSWWERFLDNGRSQPDGGHKMGVREWWERFKRRLRDGRREQTARRQGARPKIDERWEELLRRYGQWGPLAHSELDFNLVSGYGLSRLGDYSNSVKVFEKGVNQAERPGNLADLYQGLANAHYYEGYRLQPNGLAKYDLVQVRKSLKAYHQAVKLEERPVAYGNLGWMYYLLKDYQRAGEFSRQALSLNPGLEYVRLNLGLIYLMQDKVYDSFDVYRRFIQRNPSKEVYMGGINDLREVIRDHPARYPFAYLMKGLLTLKQGDYGEARDALSRFQASPFVGQSWRAFAARLLRDMDTAGLE